jgi:hypothetical protein
VSGWPATAERGRSSLQLSAEEAVDFAADLAQRRATALVDGGHYDEALAVYDEEARSYRALLGGATGRPQDPPTARRQSLHLGRVLMEIGTLHVRMRRGDAALASTAEAVAVVRGLGQPDSAMAVYVLARVLWGFSWVRAGLGVELRPALNAAEEAEGLLRSLLADPPRALMSALREDVPVLRSFLVHLQGRLGPPEQR